MDRWIILLCQLLQKENKKVITHSENTHMGDDRVKCIQVLFSEGHLVICRNHTKDGKHMNICQNMDMY